MQYLWTHRDELNLNRLSMISSFGTGDAFSKLALEKWTALGNEDHYDDDGDDGDNYGIKDNDDVFISS